MSPFLLKSRHPSTPYSQPYQKLRQFRLTATLLSITTRTLPYFTLPGHLPSLPCLESNFGYHKSSRALTQLVASARTKHFLGRPLPLALFFSPHSSPRTAELQLGHHVVPQEALPEVQGNQRILPQ